VSAEAPNPDSGLLPSEEKALGDASASLSPEQVQVLKARWIEEHQRQAFEKLYNESQ
jgi:hypothetical protein